MKRSPCRRLGLEDVKVVGCNTASGVNEQPINLDETLSGAVNRVQQARAIIPDADVWIGIESGVFRATGHQVSLDIGVVALMEGNGECVFSTSPGVTFPERFVTEAESEGFATTTVGSVIATRLGCDGTDPHTGLTGGQITRLETLIQGVMTALKHIL